MEKEEKEEKKREEEKILNMCESIGPKGEKFYFFLLKTCKLLQAMGFLKKSISVSKGVPA